MKIDKNTPINRNGNKVLSTGARAVGYAFGGSNGARIAGKVADSKPVQNIVNNIKGTNNSKDNKTKAKLQNSLSNRIKNAYNGTRKRKKEHLNGNDTKDNQQATSSVTDDIEEAAAKKVKKAIIIKIIIILAPIVLIMLLVIVVISTIGSLVPFLIPDGLSEEELNLLGGTGSTYQEEVDYAKKLNEVAKKYQSKCNVELNTNYVNASLLYLYYQTDKDIDYTNMKNNVDAIYNVFSSTCSIDYTIGGELYNNLKNSSHFINYYSPLLSTRSIDNVLTEIFNLSNEITTANTTIDYEFIPENTKIAASSEVTSGITGVTNPSLPNVTEVSFKDYLLGIIYANVDSDYLNDNEKVKAYVVALATNVLARNNLSINTSTISLMEDYNTLYCNPDYGCSYVIRKNTKALQVGGGEGGNGNNIFLAGKYYYHLSMDDSLKKNISSLINDVYGKVMADKDDKYVEVDIKKINNSNASNYEDILKNAYSNLTVKNIRENVYDNGVNYGNVLVQTPVTFYDQWDYTNSFCSTSNTIRYAGCGITAMAIITSTYENDNQYDPIYMNNRMTNVYHNGYCAYNQGTYVGFFWKEAENMGYKILNVGKYSTTDKNLVTSHLRAGHLIIARMGPGLFTDGGHYIVLSGIDPDTKSVYVTDPYNYMNKIYHGPSSGSGWHSFNNIIIPQVKGDGAFYIIWKD